MTKKLDKHSVFVSIVGDTEILLERVKIITSREREELKEINHG